MNICIYTCSLSPCILVYNHFMSKLDIWCVQHFTFHRKINYSYNIPLLISEVLRHMKKKVSRLLSSATNMFTSTYIKKNPLIANVRILTIIMSPQNRSCSITNFTTWDSWYISTYKQYNEPLKKILSHRIISII